MNIIEMRRALLKKYKATNFRLRLEKMKDDQVYAMYTRLKNQGDIK